MIERKLNDEGILEFERFIEGLRAGGKQNTPHFLLLDPRMSEPLDEPVGLGGSEFETRYDLGLHLVKGLSAVDTQPLIGDSGFWSGLALYWFDQLCPVKTDGSRKPSKAYNYILSKDYKHRPRHSVFTTWQLVEKYEKNGKKVRLKHLSPDCDAILIKANPKFKDIIETAIDDPRYYVMTDKVEPAL